MRLDDCGTLVRFLDAGNYGCKLNLIADGIVKIMTLSALLKCDFKSTLDSFPIINY